MSQSLTELKNQLTGTQTSLVSLKQGSTDRNMLQTVISGATGGLVYPDPTEEDTFGERLQEDIGEAISLGLGGGFALSKIPQAVSTANRTRRVVQNFLSNIGKVFKASPVTFTAVEGGLGGTASYGGYVTAERFPDSAVAEFVGTMAGGITPQLAVGGVRMAAGPVARAAGTATMFTAGKLTHLLPIVGGYLRAGGRAIRETGRSGAELYGRARDLSSRVTAPQRARDRFTRAGVNQQQVEEALQEELSPGVSDVLNFVERSGNRGLLKIQKSILADSKDDLLSEVAAKRLEDANAFLIADMGASVDDLPVRQFLDSQRNYFRSLLDTRLQTAAKKTETIIGGWRGVRNQEQANTIARTQLRSVFDEAIADEKALWRLIPSEVQVPTANFTRAYNRLLRELPKTQKGDMPTVARTWLRRKKAGGSSLLGGKSGVTSVKNTRGLISDLRAVARNNRAAMGGNQNLNQARIADELAEAINRDMLSNLEGSGSEAVSTAVAFSRELNETFRNPIIGRLWERTSRGSLRVPETRTLDVLIGGSRTNREGYDAILKAVGDNPEVNDAMESYIKSQFFNYSDFDRAGARRWLNANENLMSRMPRLKSEIENAIELNTTQLLKERNIPKILDPNINKAIIFMDQSPKKAFDQIINSINPGKSTRTLLRMVNRDKTGEARSGVQRAFSRYLLDKSQTDGVINGGQLAAFLDSEPIKIVMRQLYSEEGLVRWSRIRATGLRLDAVRLAKPSAEGVSGDRGSASLNFMAKILGAWTGRQMGTGTIQVPGAVSQKFKQLAEAGIVNPAIRFITDAVDDASGETFNTLMKRGFDESGVPNENGKAIIRYLNAWAAGLLTQVASGEESQPN